MSGEYPHDWKALSLLVKQEAEWRCARCGAPNHYASHYVLTVHHFDGDKANCARWNLMPLCQRCHLSVQGRVDPRQGLMAHPSLWSMPYIAGMVEAKMTPSPMTYILGDWIEEYEANVRTWPQWAPKGTRDEDQRPGRIQGTRQ